MSPKIQMAQFNGEMWVRLEDYEGKMHEIELANFRGLAHPDQHFGCVTYSQNGEDLMLANLFTLLKVERPSYLDLGAHHPTEISNTKLLYDRGSRGVNVEANPALMDAFLVERPEDTNVCLGVGPTEGLFPFYQFDNTSGRNTFDVQELNAAGFVVTKVLPDVQVVTITTVVATYCHGVYPDLLTCDLEGYDYDVLKSADFSAGGPKVICVETRPSRTWAMSNLLAGKGFALYCRMGENLIFVAHNLIGLALTGAE